MQQWYQPNYPKNIPVSAPEELSLVDAISHTFPNNRLVTYLFTFLRKWNFQCFQKFQTVTSHSPFLSMTLLLCDIWTIFAIFGGQIHPFKWFQHLKDILILKSKLTVQYYCILNTLRPGQNGCHFADDTFKRIFVNTNVRIFIEISLNLFLGVQLTIFQHWFR